LETPATLASSSTLKHEKHLRRPRADAPDPRNHGDDLVVALAAQPSRIKHHRPVPHLRRQIPQGRRLVGGQAHGQQRLRSKRQEPLRGDLTAERGDQAPMDGACRRAGQLLVQDRADQSRDVRLGRRVHPDRTGLGDEPAQDRIALGQDVSGLLGAAGRAGGYGRTGLIDNVALHHRPLGVVLAFSAEMGRRLGNSVGPGVFYHAPKGS
jgi:hypothetical protein